MLPRTHSNTALYTQSSPLPNPLQSALETLDESGIGLDNIITLLEKLPTRDMRNSLVELYWKEIESVCRVKSCSRSRAAPRSINLPTRLVFAR